MKMKLSLIRLISAVAIIASILGSGCSKEARKGRHQARADKFFDAGDYIQAEIEYLNVAKLDTSDAHALGRLGTIYFEQGRYGAAFRLLNGARKSNPNDVLIRLESGLLNLTLGLKKEAREDAVAVLDKDPKYPKAMLLLAQASDERDQETARLRLEQVLEKTGVTAESELAFGMLASQSGNFNEATQRFTHAQALDSKRPDAPNLLGILAWMTKDLTNANRLLKQAADLSKPRSSERMAYADFKIKSGSPDEGKRLLSEMTTNTPDFILPWLSLAELALNQHQFDECAAMLNQIQTRDGDNIQAQLLGARLKLVKASTAKLAGKSDAANVELGQAVAEYEKLAARFKSAPQVLFQLGLAYLAKDDNSKALRSFNQAVELNPDFEDALLQQAQLNIQMENPDAAIASMSRLIRRQPKQPMPYLVLAGAHAVKGDFDNSIATCRQLEKVTSENPRVAYVIGGFFLRQSRTNEARAEFARAQKISPEFLPAMEQLVNLDLAEKNYSAALERVNTELDKHPDYPDVLTLRGKIFITSSNISGAENSLRKAVELDSSYSPAYLLLANLYVHSKKNDEALRELNQVVAANPRDVTALTLIGMIQGEQGKDDEARATYEKLLQINPNSRIALNNLAYLYSEKFNLLDKAFEAAHKARDLAPYDPASSDTLGWIVFKRGDYSWALSLLQASAEKLPDNPEVLFHLGMTYYALNNELRSSNAFARALAPNTDFPGREEARKRLALLSLDFNNPRPEVVSALEKRLAERPDDPIALSHLASVYEKSGQSQKAAQVYEQVLKGNSENPNVLITLARLYSDQLKDPQRALELAKQAYKLAPRDPEVAHVLGRLAFATGQYKWALSLLRNARQESSDPGLLYDLAWAQYSLGQVTDAESTLAEAMKAGSAFSHAQDAREFLEWLSLSADPIKAAAASAKIQQALKESPDNVPALMASVTASESHADFVTASTACEKILKRYPDFAPALKKLAVYYSETPGKEQRAYELAVKARETLANDPDVTKALGIIFYRRGDFQSAVKLLNSLARSDSSDGKTLYYLGMAQYKLKQNADGKASLQAALSKDLSTALAEEARKVLAQIK
jgi:tetratricopeptide (TPR) repeat protein